MKNKGWAGKNWYCPFSGHVLKSYDKLLSNNDQSQLFYCTDSECFHHNVPLNFFNSTGGYKSKAGDSWAIGYVK